MATTEGTTTYRMEPLKENNWLPWKRRMLAVLREQNLDKYVIGDSKILPIVSTTSTPPVTMADVTAWQTGELKASVR
ncbi:hypothetical protein MD484_g8858, partial [Candolleomyces efflorescens]